MTGRNGYGRATSTAARRVMTTGATAPISPTPRRSSRRPGARIRSGLTEAEIAHARRVAEISAEAVARYDRKGRARNRPIGRASSINRFRCRTVASFERCWMPGVMSTRYFAARSVAQALTGGFRKETYTFTPARSCGASAIPIPRRSGNGAAASIRDPGPGNARAARRPAMRRCARAFSPPGAYSYPTGPMSIATMLDTIKTHTVYQMRASIMSPSSSSIGIPTRP